MSDMIDWKHTSLVIPKEYKQEAFFKLDEIAGDIGLEGFEHFFIDNKIINILGFKGYEAEMLNSGDIRIFGSIIVDPYIDDPFLNAFIGIVRPGSYITSYDDWGTYTQLRYTQDQKTVVYGKVVFPKDEEYPFLTEFETD